MGYALKQNGKQVHDHWGKKIIFGSKESADSFLAGGNKFVDVPPGCTVVETKLGESGNHGGASFDYDAATAKK